MVPTENLLLRWRTLRAARTVEDLEKIVKGARTMKDGLSGTRCTAKQAYHALGIGISPNTVSRWVSFSNVISIRLGQTNGSDTQCSCNAPGQTQHHWD